MVKLNTNFTFLKDELLPFPRKNFAAFCFFDFFWKGKKIMSFPMQSTIFPWGFSEYWKSETTQDIFLKEGFTSIKHIYFSQQHVTPVSFDIFNNIGRPQNIQFYFWFSGFFKEKVYFSNEGFMREKPICAQNRLCISFEEKMKHLVFDPIYLCSEEVLVKVFDFLFDQKIKKKVDVIKLIGLSNINFCSAFPCKKIINLDEYFSQQEIIELINCVEDLDDNPFKEVIETSIEEYKEFLLTLVGPEKWEYTNLNINEITLSIEELLCLFSLINFLPNPFDDQGVPDLFFPPSRYDTLSNLQLPYIYFWHKLKQTVLNHEQAKVS